MDANEKDALKFCAALAFVALCAVVSIVGIIALIVHYFS
jgi:hypothetical protein